MDIPFADQLLALLAERQARRSGGIAPVGELDLAQVHRVLLVLTTGLGDAVLSTPVFPALRAALPDARIALLTRHQWSALFEADPDLDAVMRYRGKHRGSFSLLRELRRFAPQLILVLHGNDPDIIPLMVLTGARTIIRVPTEGTRFRHLLSNSGRAQDAHTVPGMHYIDNRLRVLDALGIAPVSRSPRIQLSSEACVAARERFAQRGPYWIYHAFAADPYKSWPIERARSFLAAALARYEDHDVLLTGTRVDRAPLEALAASFDGRRLRVIAGESSIMETAAMIQYAACVVAPDTGILHLAAALDRPVVGLYAPTFATLVGPRSLRAPALVLQKPQTCVPCVEKSCPHVPRHCMGQISAEEALEALGGALTA